MKSDVVLFDEVVKIQGNLQVGEKSYQDNRRPIYTEDGEIHSGGGAGGISFGDRSHFDDMTMAGLPHRWPFVEQPTKGERWVLYAKEGTARLWSGNDKLVVNADGKVSVAALKIGGTLEANHANAKTIVAEGVIEAAEIILVQAGTRVDLSTQIAELQISVGYLIRQVKALEQALKNARINVPNAIGGVSSRNWGDTALALKKEPAAFVDGLQHSVVPQRRE